jgi:hypothetical protein
MQRTQLKQLQGGTKKNQVPVTNGVGFDVVLQDRNITLGFPDAPVNGTFITDDNVNNITIAQTTAGITKNLIAPDDITAGLEKTVSNTGTVDIAVNGNIILAGKSAKYVWTGSIWNSVGSPSLNGVTVSQEFTATAAQTVFTIVGTIATGAQTIVYINGVRITPLAVVVAGNNVNYTPALNSNFVIQAGDRVTVDVYVLFISNFNTFTATAAQTAFTLSQPLATGTFAIPSINGIRLPLAAYSVAAATFTYIPAGNNGYILNAGDSIIINY